MCAVAIAEQAYPNAMFGPFLDLLRLVARLSGCIVTAAPSMMVASVAGMEEGVKLEVWLRQEIVTRY